MTVAFRSMKTSHPKRSWLYRIMWGIGLLTVIVFGAAFGTYYFLTDDIRSLTTHLATVDRVDVELVHVKFETIDKVIAIKTLTATAAQDFRDIWRAQNYIYGASVMCHTPAYRIRFYQQEKLLTEATVCFHCHNIYFYKYPGAKTSDTVIEAVFGNMRDDNPQFLKLRNYLSSLFPDHDVEAESTQRPN